MSLLLVLPWLQCGKSDQKLETMETNGPTITKELKSDIEVNQIQLINAIRNHQVSFCWFSEKPLYVSHWSVVFVWVKARPARAKQDQA